MDGLYVLFMAAVVIFLAVDYAAQFQPPDHEAPSDEDAGARRAQGDDAA